MQSETLLQNAGESLVDLTIDPNSPQGDFGLGLLEDILKKLFSRRTVALSLFMREVTLRLSLIFLFTIFIV